MKAKHLQILLGLTFLVLIGGAGYLAVANVPVHSAHIEKTIPNDRFLH